MCIHIVSTYEFNVYIQCWDRIVIKWEIYFKWLVQFAFTLAEGGGRRSIQFKRMQWWLHSVYVNPINIIRLLCCAAGNQFCLENNLYLLFAGYRYRWSPTGRQRKRVRGRDGMLQLVLLLLWKRATNLKAQFVHLCQLVTRSKIKRINKMCWGQALATRGCGQRIVESREWKVESVEHGTAKRVKYIQRLLPLDLAMLLLLQRYKDTLVARYGYTIIHRLCIATSFRPSLAVVAQLLLPPPCCPCCPCCPRLVAATSLQTNGKNCRSFA